MVDIMSKKAVTKQEILSNLAMCRDKKIKLVVGDCVVSESDFSSQDLNGIVFRDSIVMSCNFSFASFVRSEFKKTEFIRCSFDSSAIARAKLYECSFYKCSFVGANFNMSELSECSFHDCDFSKSDMRGSSFYDRPFLDCSFEGTKVTPGSPTEESLREENRRQVHFSETPYPHSSFGSKTASVIKARKSSGKPQGFYDKSFPDESRKIKDIVKGRPINGEVLASVESLSATKIEDGKPLVWLLTKSTYSGPQRISEAEDSVILFNISPERWEWDRFYGIIEYIRRHNHPNEYGKIFTIGWVRYFVHGDTVLVEEVQSDVDGILKKMMARSDYADPESWSRTMADGIGHFHSYAEAFYYDAVGTIFQLAELEGKSVEMLSYEQKQQFGSPRSVYEDLPRKMGMRPGESSVPDIKGKVWRYTPNRRRG